LLRFLGHPGVLAVVRDTSPMRAHTCEVTFASGVAREPREHGKRRCRRAMDTSASNESLGDVASRRWRGPVTNVVLLMAGIAAVVVYVIGDLLSGLLYDGYSYKDQAISELSAFGSPVRPLMVTVILTHGVLVVAFGVGVLRASRRRSVSWVGGLLIAIGVVGFPTHTVWAMSSRDMEGGFNDTMHIILSAVFSVLVIAAMALSAVAYRGWFRLYALATIAVAVGFGMAASFAIQGIEQNDTPWAGGFERINAYAYFAWLIVLAVTVMRRETPATRSRGERGITQ
jgi:hypothetical membrane protein